MSDNNHKLGFFDRLKKSRLIKNITIDGFKNAPAIFQTDMDVIEALISKDADNIDLIDPEVALKYLDFHPEIIKKLNIDLCLKYIELKPELFQYVDKITLLQRLVKLGKRNLIKKLPTDVQLELLFR